MKVLVQSFSFRRTGYPADKTGHGGGFIWRKITGREKIREHKLLF